MISVKNRIYVKPNGDQHVEVAVRHIIGCLKDESGFHHYRLLPPTDVDAPYLLLTFWQSRRHYQAHRALFSPLENNR